MSEASEQREIIKWFATEYPEYIRCVRVSLAGLNFGSGQRAARMVNHVRSQGIQEGESDIAAEDFRKLSIFFGEGVCFL